MTVLDVIMPCLPTAPQQGGGGIYHQASLSRDSKFETTRPGVISISRTMLQISRLVYMNFCPVVSGTAFEKQLASGGSFVFQLKTQNTKEFSLSCSLFSFSLKNVDDLSVWKTNVSFGFPLACILSPIVTSPVISPAIQQHQPNGCQQPIRMSRCGGEQDVWICKRVWQGCVVWCNG